MEAGNYSKDLIKNRRAVVESLYYGNREEERINSLREMLSLGRPVVIVLDLDRHHEFLGWLKSKRIGISLIQNEQSLAWASRKF